MERLTSLDIYSDARFMKLDLAARRNLELLETMRSKEKRGSLLGVLDRTKTAMGKRLIRSWIEQPLINPAQIIRRHNAVEELTGDSILRGDLLAQLADIYDLERIMTRIGLRQRQRQGAAQPGVYPAQNGADPKPDGRL